MFACAWPAISVGPEADGQARPMVKIATKEIDAFVKRPAGPSLRAVLVYGPDRGLVAERAAMLAHGVVEFSHVHELLLLRCGDRLDRGSG